MILRCRWLLSFTLVLGCVLPLAGQGGLDWMTSRTWRIQDGLPDQVVQAIAQTPDHYLWLGSKLGLVRFDGYHFTDYGVEAAPVLREFGVTCILPARDGSLWLGTQGGGVVHLLRGIVRVRTYAAAEGIENGLIRSLYQDEVGRIWAGADHGLYRLASPGANEKFQRVDDPAAAPNLGIHAIISDGHGGVWAGGSRLLHYGPLAERGPWSEIKLPRQPTSVRIWSLAVAPDKSLYVGTLGGLFRVTSAGEVQRQNRIPGSTLSLHLDGKQRLWVGTLADGLFLVDRDGSVSRAIAPSQLARNAVLAIAEDFGHEIWVGTQSGLERFSATGMQITRIPGAVDAEFGSVSVDDDSSVWVGSRQLVHMQQGSVRTVVLPALHGAAVRSVMRERSGAFWAGTLGRGAYRIAPDGHVDHYTSAIGTNYIRGFLETPDDGVWIASDGGVANWHNGHLKSYQEIPGSPLAPAIAMSAGAPGELWVGTYRGLYLLKQGRYINSAAASALGGHVVWALHRSRDGALWIGTERGLFRWSNGVLRRVRLDRDMADSSILSILEDGRGRMWLAGMTTVLRAERSALDAIADGLPEGAFFSPEIFAVSRETGAELTGGATSTAQLDGADGAWFATHEGPLHIQPSMAEADLTPPPIMLHSVVMDGRHSAAGQSFTLQPSVKTLEIEAAPVVLSSRPGLRLRRRLIGFDTSWFDLSTRNVATYTNLPPGNYIFRVEASWEGKSGMTFLEIPIIQRAHFYQQPAFLFGCAVLVLLAVWIVHLFRVRQMTLRFRLISDERNRVAREIHDTVVQSCIGVSSLLEAIAIRQPREASGSETMLLDTAREQIALTIVEARDAIWDLRHPHEEGGLAHALRSMLDRMMAVQNTLVEFKCEGTPRALEREAEHELLMTAREALHNSIAHASSTHVLLRLRYEADKVTIHLHDDGRGFDASAHHTNESMHFGLVGMHERMERISGSCTIVSVPGRGADVTLELPTGRHARGMQSV